MQKIKGDLDFYCAITEPKNKLSSDTIDALMDLYRRVEKLEHLNEDTSPVVKDISCENCSSSCEFSIDKNKVRQVFCLRKKEVRTYLETSYCSDWTLIPENKVCTKCKFYEGCEYEFEHKPKVDLSKEIQIVEDYLLGKKMADSRVNTITAFNKIVNEINKE